MTLYSAIEHAKIVLMINDPQKSKGFRSLHFREAFHDPNLFSDKLCEQIKKDEFYKSFKSFPYRPKLDQCFNGKFPSSLKIYEKTKSLSHDLIIFLIN